MSTDRTALALSHKYCVRNVAGLLEEYELSGNKGTAVKVPLDSRGFYHVQVV